MKLFIVKIVFLILILFSSFAGELRELTSQFTGEVFKVSVFSEQKADELFNYLASKKSIPFHVKFDGCYARAYLMNSYAKIKKAELAKLVVEVVNENQVMLVSSPNEKWRLRWYYHVAPIIFVKLETDAIELRVLDPSLFNKPVSKAKFLTKLTRENPSVITENFILPKYITEKQQLTSSINFRKLDQVMQENLIEVITIYKGAGSYHEKKPVYDPVFDEWFQGGWEVASPAHVY